MPSSAEKELERLVGAAGAVTGGWDDHRVRRGERDLLAARARRLARRGRARRLAWAGLPVALGVTALLLAPSWRTERRPGPEPRPTAVASGPRPPPSELPLPDGSMVRLLAPGTRLVPRAVAATNVELALEAGAAAFEVTRDERRRFRVETPFAQIEVRGTAFVVRAEPRRTRVSVSRGSVDVTWSGRTCSLRAGDSDVFPGAAGPCAGTASAPPAEPVTSAPAAGPAAAPRARAGADRGDASWRAMAGRGDYARAYEAWHELGRPAVGRDPADLLLAADVARLSGHPAEAVPPLREILRRHPGSAHAPVAAFTLGRILGDQLQDAAGAAEAFARARRLDRAGTLGRQALAREAEARCKAGDRARFEALAAEYLRSDPQGPWAAPLRARLRAGCPSGGR